MGMEWNPLGCHREPEGVRLRMLGPLAIERGGAPLELPASRKTCGLLAFLALTPAPGPAQPALRVAVGRGRQ